MSINKYIMANLNILEATSCCKKVMFLLTMFYIIQNASSASSIQNHLQVANQQAANLRPQTLSPYKQMPNLFNRPHDQQQQQQQPQHHQQQQQQQPQQPIQQQQMNPYTKAWNDLLLDLRQQMLTKSIKFDETFRTLLLASKLSLHKMFAETYGMMYEQNTEIFTTMFESLEQYYANGQVKLTKSMDQFFEKLHQKVFYLFLTKPVPQSYLDCATQQLAELKPFKDVPEKLTNGIRHTFVAARTFFQALNSGMDIIKTIISLGQPAQCNLIDDKLLKNSRATTDGSPTGARLPCLPFCEQVLMKCVGKINLEQLNEKWKGYVLALNDLAMKLSTSYNIETIIAPLDVQISEAIMNFQENSTHISQQVSQACSKPILANGPESHVRSPRLVPNRLAKRAASLGPIPSAVSQTSHHQNRHSMHASTSGMRQPMDIPSFGGHLRAAAKERTAHIGTSIPSEDLSPGQKSPLIDDIRNYMLTTKSFWNTLPHAVCTSNYTLGPNASGAAKNQKQSNCFHENFQLLDLNTDLRYRFEIQQQVDHLESVRQKILSALEGVEIEWADNSDNRYPTGPTIGGRLYPTTTTTTTTTPEPSTDDDEEDDDSVEGSGEDSETELLDSNDEHEIDTTTENNDPDEEVDNSGDDSTSEDTTSQSSSTSLSEETSTPPNMDQENRIDQSLNDITNDLITPPNQPGAQKSSQTSTKLVINNGSHLLFTLLMSVALLIVNRPYSSSNHQLIGPIINEAR